jgi:transcriptional regulator GlxA family with amidase domain
MFSRSLKDNRIEAPIRVGIVLTAKFTLNALANFVDVLRLAGDEGDGSQQVRCHWHIMSPSKRPLVASCGFEVSPTSGLIDPAKLNYVAIVGGLLYRGAQIDSVLRDYLLRVGQTPISLIGICTGSFVLCRLGLMRGKRCCTSWYHYHDFRAEFSDSTPTAEELWVVHGNRITCSGGIGSAHVAAHLAERHIGRAQARKALRIMQIDDTRLGAHLQPAPLSESRCDNDTVTRALLLMEQNVDVPLSILQIAKSLHISKRTLERNFERSMSIGPLAAYLKVRLSRARWMLKSRHPLRVIAVETGFASASQLRAAFQRIDGVAPTGEYPQLGHEMQSVPMIARDALAEESVSTPIGDRFAGRHMCPAA